MPTLTGEPLSDQSRQLISGLTAERADRSGQIPGYGITEPTAEALSPEASDLLAAISPRPLTTLITAEEGTPQRRLIEAAVRRSLFQDEEFTKATTDEQRLARYNALRAEYGLPSLQKLPADVKPVSLPGVLLREFSTPRGLAGKVPFAGETLLSTADLVRIVVASKRIEAGKESPQDYQVLADATARMAESERPRTFPGLVAGYAAQIPTLAAEFGMTFGAGTAARKGATMAAAKVAGESVAKAVERTLARKGIRGLTDIGAQVAAFEALKLAPSTMQRMIPEVGAFDGELLVFPGESAKRAAVNAGFDIGIEVVSERSGATLLAFGKWSPLRKAGEFVHRKTGLPKLSIGAKEFLNRIGYQGPIPEVGEERLGEFLRQQATNAGLVDLPQTAPTGRQIAAETLAFSVPMAGALATEAVGRRALASGLRELEEAERRFAETTEAPAEVPPAEFVGPPAPRAQPEELVGPPAPPPTPAQPTAAPAERPPAPTAAPEVMPLEPIKKAVFKADESALAEQVLQLLPDKLKGRVKVAKKGTKSYKSARTGSLVSRYGAQAVADAVVRGSEQTAPKRVGLTAATEAMAAIYKEKVQPALESELSMVEAQGALDPLRFETGHLGRPGYTFRKKIPAEIKEALAGKPFPVRAAFRVAKDVWDVADGADVMAEIGADEMVANVEKFLKEVKSPKARADAALREIERNPEMFSDEERFAAKAYKELSTGEAEFIERVPASDLEVGSQFAMGGEKFEVVDVDPETGARGAIDDVPIRIPETATVPIDKGSLGQRKPGERLTYDELVDRLERYEFLPPERAQERAREMLAAQEPAAPQAERPVDLLGQPVIEPATGRQRELEMPTTLTGEQMADTGVVTEEGLYRPDLDRAAADELRQQIADGQLILPKVREAEDETSVEGIGLLPPSAARPAGVKSERKYLPEEVRKRIDKAFGVKQPSLARRIADWSKRQGLKVNRVQIHLPGHKRFASARDFFRKLSDAPRLGNEDGVRHAAAVVSGISAEDLPVLRDFLIMRNQLHGLNLAQIQPLRLGWKSREQLEQALADIQPELASRPAIMDALKTRKKMNTELLEQLVEVKLASKEILNNVEDYYHQQVLKYAALDKLGSVPVTTDPSGQKIKPSFLRSRLSAEGLEVLPEEYDYNTSFIEAETRWLSDAYTKLRIVRLFQDYIEKQYDLYPQLKLRAKRTNFERAVGGPEVADWIYALRAELRDLREQLQYAESADKREIRQRMAEIGEELMAIDPTRPFDQDIAKGLALIERSYGSLTDPYEVYEDDDVAGLPWERIKEMAEAKVPIDRGIPFGELSPQAKAKIGALMIFRGITGRNAKITELAEKNGGIADWSDFVPKDHLAWYPAPGNIVFRATTIEERIAERIMRGEISEAKITKDDLRRVLAIGMPRSPVVIPSPIARQLDELTTVRNVVGRADARLMAAWKAYLLLAPHNIGAYNLRNPSGDYEGIIIAAVPVRHEISRAIVEMLGYYRGELKMSADLRAARDHSSIGSSMAARELPALKEVQVFERFFSKRRPLHELPVAAVQKYFEVAHRWTEFRENLLRYATFLAYKKMLIQEAKTPGSLKHFGNSRRQDVLEILRRHGVDAAAGKMSRELLGDYGDITVFGQWMRAHLYPFWSWQEINLHRVPRLAWNSLLAKDRKAAGVIPAAALRALLISRLAWMYAGFWSWNNLIHGHKEEELTFYDRANPHIVVCRLDDGSIAVFRNVGAMGDFLEWFGLNTFLSRIREMETNSLTWSELIEEMRMDPVNKLYGGIRPDIKALLEGSTGLTFFPDIRNPRSVNRGWLTAQNLGLADVYAAASGALRRNGMRARPHALARTMLGVVDPRENALTEAYSLRDRYFARLGRRKGTFPRSDFAHIRESLIRGNYEAFKEALGSFIRRKQDQGIHPIRSLKDGFSNLDPISERMDDLAEWRFEQEFLTSSQRRRLAVARDFAMQLKLTGYRWYAEAYSDTVAPALRQAGSKRR